MPLLRSKGEADADPLGASEVDHLEPTPISAPDEPVSRRRVGDVGMVFALALLVRAGLVLLSRGGPKGNFGYDAGVYYTAADALIHGRLPYQDFTLLHPPGLMLVLTPFAGLGRLTTDHMGFVAANTAFAVLGALNAALVVAVARQLNLARSAALIGGIFYAVWYGAAGAEISSRLEPLGSFLFLCGLLFLTRDHARARRYLVFAGMAFGAAIAVKIWWSAPVLVAFAWQLRGRETRRQLGWLAAGVLLSVSVVVAPFFLAAPSEM